MGSPTADVLRAWRDALSQLDLLPLRHDAVELDRLARQLGEMYQQLNVSPRPYPARMVSDARALVDRAETVLGSVGGEAVKMQGEWY